MRCDSGRDRRDRRIHCTLRNGGIYAKPLTYLLYRTSSYLLFNRAQNGRHIAS
jgi:hypothetical protein